MAVPIVSGSEVNTPASTVPLDSRAFREAALAPGRLAEAIGQNVGGFFQDVSQQIQDVRNSRQVFEADVAMRKTKSNFVDSLTKDPTLASDPGKWTPAWQQVAKQTTDGILNNPSLSPVVKRHLTQMAGIWEMDSTSEIRTQALRRETADTKTAGMASAELALQANQPDQAVAAYKTLNENGIIGPKVTATLIKQVPQKIAENQANGAIVANPIDAPRIIQDKLGKDLPPQKLRTLLAVAKQAQAKERTSNAEELSGRVDDSPDHTIDEKLLKGWRDSGKIDDRQYERIQNRVKAYGDAAQRQRNADDRAHDKDETDSMHIAMMEADNPPTDAKSLDSWAKEIKDEGLEWTNPAHRQHLNEYVDRKVKAVLKDGEKGENITQSRILTDMYHDRLFDANEVVSSLTKKNEKGEFAASDEDIEKSYGKGSTRQSVVNEARLKRARAMQQMRDWFKANPEGKEEDAERYREKIMAAPIEDAVRAALSKTSP